MTKGIGTHIRGCAIIALATGTTAADAATIRNGAPLRRAAMTTMPVPGCPGRCLLADSVSWVERRLSGVARP